MNLLSKLRRTFISEGQIYKISDLFTNSINEQNVPEIDNPEFYNTETHTLKLGNLCKNEQDKGSVGNIEWNNNKYTTYCALLQLSNTVPLGIQNKLHRNIDIIYDFLRRDLSLDNRRKFHDLVRTIFNYDNPANTIDLIADYITKTDNVEEIKRSLDLFRKESVGESDIEDFLRKAKFTAYKEYENSFVGDHFDTKEYKLFLRYRSEQENRTIYAFVKEVMGGKMNITDAVAYLHQSILNNYDPIDMVKGDLICKKPLYNSKEQTIIYQGDVVEVKKLDHAGDSYLSEFFSIYKDKNLPKDAFEPQFLKTYNAIVDGLFGVFKSTGKNILEDIKNNFAGIIYDENIFIPAKDIELYWSNKGRGSCAKDHRLSIRYRISKPTLQAYVYEKNNDVLISKKLDIQLDKELIYCPIIKSKSVDESYSLKEISNLLTEGRKEDARVKYSQFSDEIFNFYVENDPSDNQKYLNWMLKSTILDSNQYDRVKKFSNDYHNSMVNAINYFHNNIQRFKKRDINSYYDLNELEREINGVKSKKSRKEERLEGGDKIFEDKNLTVVVPTNREGSCLYGANTRWCVSARENNFFKEYRKDGILFFLIWRLKMPENLENYQKIARYIPHGYEYETEGEYFSTNDTRMTGSDIETVLFGKRTYYEKGLGMVITHIPTKSKSVYDSWESAKIAIDTYYAKNGMNLPNTRTLDDDFDDFDDFMTENLVLEGRKEDARAKYPQFSDEIFNFYVENDPSGNQKYLDWLLKNTNSTYDHVTDNITEIMDMVKFFHQNQQMFIEKDINRHTITSLDREIDDVKEKLLQKEKRKEAKKQSIKLYEDNRWLAISPKSWQASCYYGAGTKWCVTMKDNSSYWHKYSKNATFIFIIDKTKPQEDPLYKVAYRMIGRRGKYELWNAPDHEISKGPIGRVYFEELPQELKEKALKLHEENFPQPEGRQEWVDDDPRAQALINNIDAEDIEDVEDYWYGLHVYQADDEYYAVGDSAEVDEAIYQYYDDYSDGDLMEYYDYEGYYLTMNDEEDFINEEVESYLDNSSDNELLDFSGLTDENTVMEDELRELRDELDSLDTEEDAERIEEIEDEISTLEFNIDDLLERAKEKVSTIVRREWESCFGDGVVNCLVNERGWYNNARDLYKSGLVELDRSGLLSSIVENTDYDVIGGNGYSESQDDDGNYWYIYPIDY